MALSSAWVNEFPLWLFPYQKYPECRFRRVYTYRSRYRITARKAGPHGKWYCSLEALPGFNGPRFTRSFVVDKLEDLRWKSKDIINDENKKAVFLRGTEISSSR